MISRRRCQEIAQEWVSQKGLEEHGRRLDSLRRNRREYREFAHKLDMPYDEAPAPEHYRMATDAFLAGMYDPPPPSIPLFWQRWFLRDWTPADPTPEEWPMYTGPGTSGYERRAAAVSGESEG